MMDSSLEQTRSLEHTPLLRNSSTPIINDHEAPTPTFPKVSVFTCAVVCILFTELCERLTFYGINGNLVLFSTENDHLSMTATEASILAYMFQGTCFILPILGGWLADSVTGKFSVILFSALIYLVGTILLPIGSITHDPGEHSTWAANNVTKNTTFKRAVYIAGLFLVAFGTGGIKANVSPFGAEQVSNRGPKAIQAFFSWFYWFINIGALLAFTLVVGVQQSVSYFYGNLIPACSLVLALIIFLTGKPYYNISPPTGSILSTTLKIVREAIKRSRRPSLSSSFVNHWLDRAKMCYGGTYSSWEVDDVKKVYRLLPIFATYILYWTVYAQMNTSMVYQGEYMDITLGSSFQIPIASLSILDTLGVLVLIPIMDKLIYPLLGKCGIHLSQLQRIGIGMIISTASMACAGGIEMLRVDQCCKNVTRGDDHLHVSRITIFYQVPQYTLIGLSEVFTSITGLELAYTEAPKSLQGVIMGVFLVTTGLGTYVGAALVAIVNAVSGAAGGADKKWYPDKKYINDKGHYLAYYFFLLAGLMFLNFILYIFIAASYKAKKESANRATQNNGTMGSGLPSNPKVEDSWTSSNHDRVPP